MDLSPENARTVEVRTSPKMEGKPTNRPNGTGKILREERAGQGQAATSTAAHRGEPAAKSPLRALR